MAKKKKHTKATKEGWKVSWVPKSAQGLDRKTIGIAAVVLLAVVSIAVLMYTDIIDISFEGITSDSGSTVVENVKSKEEASAVVQDMSSDISDIADEIEALDAGIGA